jgi:hypothetical protein
VPWDGGGGGIGGIGGVGGVGGVGGGFAGASGASGASGTKQASDPSSLLMLEACEVMRRQLREQNELLRQHNQMLRSSLQAAAAPAAGAFCGAFPGGPASLASGAAFGGAVPTGGMGCVLAPAPLPHPGGPLQAGAGAVELQPPLSIHLQPCGDAGAQAWPAPLSPSGASTHSSCCGSTTTASTTTEAQEAGVV